METPESRLVHEDSERSWPRLVTDVLVMSASNSISDYVTSLFRGSGWTIATRRDCGDGISFVNENRAAVTICDEILSDGSWQDLALAFSTIPHAPALIVVSDDPDLEKEVVALGGFDVLARYLNPADVIWSVASAWHAWWKRYEERDGGVQCFDA
jgi:hypothetical protein